ncbi:hypothetical protein [Variovorax sp. Root434]|uniref:hypothetical protein n=1 Tax=Variovorax sp. Root434 TaxID=1736536 RepID=UPI0006FF0977|nr:hypothetical protein [Variovorax sp. Root434]KQX24515.1 hypothetical protein ASD05_10560 [Variovorax sp. Root434]
MTRSLWRAAACAGALATAMATGPAAAQAGEGLEGDWKARLTIKSGRQFDADLQLQATGGTWRTILQSTGDACIGIPTPMQWRRLDSGDYELHFQGSKALTGCRDNVITFQRIDATTLKGRSDAGVEIVLTRR